MKRRAIIHFITRLSILTRFSQPGHPCRRLIGKRCDREKYLILVRSAVTLICAPEDSRKTSEKSRNESRVASSHHAETAYGTPPGGGVPEAPVRGAQHRNGGSGTPGEEFPTAVSEFGEVGKRLPFWGPVASHPRMKFDRRAQSCASLREERPQRLGRDPTHTRTTRSSASSSTASPQYPLCRRPRLSPKPIARAGVSVSARTASGSATPA